MSGPVGLLQGRSANRANGTALSAWVRRCRSALDEKAGVFIGSYSAFDDTMGDWRDDLVRWRCGLSEADRKRLGAPPGWNCRDVKFFVGRISFDQLGPDRAAALNAVETRLKLPLDQVETLIAAGHDALRTNPTFRDFLKSMPGVQPSPPPVTVPTPRHSTPVATSDIEAREASAE
jgi:NTE family protein